MFTSHSVAQRVAIAGAALAMLSISACSHSSTAPSESSSSKPLDVVVAFYPFQFATEQVGGSNVKVTSLTAPGAEPHDLELTPQQVTSLDKADLVVYQSGFQSAVDKAISQQKPKHSLDIATVVKLMAPNQESSYVDADNPSAEPAGENEAVDTYGRDPHAWLDPIQMKSIVDAVASKLENLEPNHADTFKTNAAALDKKLDELNTSYSALSSCPQTTFITSHTAFGYLADRYGLHQIGIAGMSPDEEPSPKRIAEVAQIATQRKITTIFYETLVSPATADAIAHDSGLKTDVLDPLEGITDKSRGKDYLQVMETNLTALKQANGCTK